MILEPDFLDTPLLRAAFEFAQLAHAGRNREFTDAPFIEHAVAVARIIDEQVDHDEVLIAAALLQHTIEAPSASLADIHAAFGGEIADIVECLSDDSRSDDGSRATRKGLERDRLSSAGASAQTIKVADLIVDCADVAERDPTFAVVLLTESTQLLPLLTKAHPRLVLMALQTITAAQNRLGFTDESPR